MYLTACTIIAGLAIFLPIFLTEDDPIVTLPLGKIEGDIRKSVDGRKFYSFEGVPYAQPPVGGNRFEEPRPVEAWEGIWAAKTIHKCLQRRHLVPSSLEDPVTGSEDCLYLNIYTPTLDRKANLDVIVYIHGGAFMFNYGGFQKPDILLNKNIVYINFNYRLGPLGFLSTEDDVVPGNNGLKDQIAALNFIRDNIIHFGGNPNSITIAGNSAGGASVHFHYLINKSRGLFQKGISQSGTVLNPWVLMEKPLEKTKRIASLLGCPTNKSKEIVACLKQRPGRQIVEAVKSFQPWLYNPFSPFGVVVDSWATHPLLPEHPYQLLKKKLVYDAPWIASHVAAEGLYPAAEFYSNEQFLADIDRRWNDIVPHVLHYNETVDSNNLEYVNNQIRQYYFGNGTVTRETYGDLVQMVTDRLFIVDIHKSVKLHATATDAPTYLYYFTYRGTHSRSDLRSQTKNNFGAAHADDASYILYMNLDTVSTEPDRSVSNLLVNIWMSIAKTGKPNIPSVNWTPVFKNNEKLNYLKISSSIDLTMEIDGDLGHKQFWNSLPFHENERLYASNKEEL